ncbi:MAG: ATP-dependent sacrificial sulfur transferase LarE [Oscillospiraceae bacterium]|nr:ATP-dependent sacrificial sulfur transferase LarE [Oscillospiraceae bacterium]
MTAEAPGPQGQHARLQAYLNQNPRVAIAFSGGVDSSYLLYAAKIAGCDARAYLIKTRFQPQFEIADAKRLAETLAIPLTIGELDVLSYRDIAQNPPDRCYHCKTAIITKLWELVREDGIDVLCDGTNADDDETDRPGMRALRENGVVSPLRACGLRKDDIRRLSKQAGLSTHDKPAYACLATRIPTGTTITGTLLEAIEHAENVLFDMGFTDFRVRVIPDKQDDNSAVAETRFIARIQVRASQWDAAASQRSEILAALRPGFSGTVLDMETR